LAVGGEERRDRILGGKCERRPSRSEPDEELMQIGSPRCPSYRGVGVDPPEDGRPVGKVPRPQERRRVDVRVDRIALGEREENRPRRDARERRLAQVGKVGRRVARPDSPLDPLDPLLDRACSGDVVDDGRLVSER
jgi:hypothetical protein